MRGIYWKGKILAPKKVILSPLNSGLLFGEALFESLPVYGGNAFFLKEHLDRLKKGCRFLGWPFPGAAVFERAIGLFLKKEANSSDFLIRFNLVQEFGSSPGPKLFFRHPPVLFAMIRPLRHDIHQPFPSRGKAGIGRWKAFDSQEVPNGFKIPFYLPTRSDLREHPDWDELLRLNGKGEVVDGGTATPLWFDGLKINVPPLKLGGLESITRIKVLKLCSQNQIPWRERAWKPADVLEATGVKNLKKTNPKGELFFIGSGLGILSVSHLLGRKLKAPPRLASRVWQAYRNLVLSRKPSRDG